MDVGLVVRGVVYYYGARVGRRMSWDGFDVTLYYTMIEGSMRIMKGLRTSIIMYKPLAVGERVRHELNINAWRGLHFE